MADPRQAALPPKISTPDAAIKWCEELVIDVELARIACDSPALVAVDDQKKAFHSYLLRHGTALGAIGAILRVGLIQDVAYNALVTRVRATMLPTVSELGRRK